VLTLRRRSGRSTAAAPRTVGPPALEVQTMANFLRSDDADWLTYNRDYRSQRYSPLNQITPQNVRVPGGQMHPSTW